MAFLDLILFAAIAAFLGYRLWLVLGTHEADKPPRKRKSAKDDDVIPIRARSATTAAATDAAATKPQETPAADEASSVETDRFLQGATIAFRTIVEAYASGDVEKLRNLIEGPLRETFEDAIAKRKKAKKTLEVDMSHIVSAEIIDQQEEKKMAYVTVRFVSEQCLVTRNAKGAVLEGDPDRYMEVIDIWTFARPIDASSPNWRLVATQAPEA